MIFSAGAIGRILLSLGQTINLINVNQFQSIFHDYAVGYGLSWLREWKGLNKAEENASKRSMAANYLVLRRRSSKALSLLSSL